MWDYYNILEITKDATEEEIKMSYKKLAKKFHPDKNRDNQEEATSKFKLISEAYQVLSDAVMREAYDRNGKENNVFWNIENFCFNRYGRNNDFEDCDIDTFLNHPGINSFYNECMEDHLDPDTPIHSHINTFVNYYDEDKEINNEDHYELYDDYDRSTSNTTNENKSDENDNKNEEDYINFFKCQNIKLGKMQNIEEFEDITNNNSGLNMELGDKDIRLNKDGPTLINYYDEENEEMIIEDKKISEGLKSNEEIVINDGYEREGKTIIEDIVIEDEGEVKNIYQETLIEDSLKRYKGKNFEKRENLESSIKDDVINNVDSGVNYEYEQPLNNRTKYRTNRKSSNICSICDQSFHYKSQLSHHMKVHGSYGAKFTTKIFHADKRRKLQCNYCNKLFFDKFDLMRHMVSHKEEIDFKCEDCGKALINSLDPLHLQCA